MVELCNKAETGVGPSIASFNQAFNGIKALLAEPAIIKERAKMKTKSPFKLDTKLNIVAKDKSENIPIEKTRANMKNKSPILFKNSALLLALFAAILVYQKLTNK
jgi:hypothetical protein